MMSAVKILTPTSSAICCASDVTLTSKARMQAYSFCPFLSRAVDAAMTSRLFTGPMLITDTGIFTASDLRNSRSASSDPKVDAWTQTPSPDLSTEDRMLLMSEETSFLSSSSSSSGPSTNTGVPARTLSRPVATIFTPCAPLISLWWMYDPFTRISRIGCGVTRARICVTTGPEMPQHTMFCPSFSVPFTRITSMVVPSPSIIFTSSTVACRSLTYCSFSAMRVCGSCTRRPRRSGRPSPVMAEVGTTLMYDRGSGFSQYRAAFRPCSLKERMHASSLCLNSRLTCFCCASKLA
mmetsp:Transcript_19071/g.32059  ORF Transcript_19071/g.32059 Transcript_19071/m.32059 type:complete len:294 (-) Transcript_19071:936-1817(-)